MCSPPSSPVALLLIAGFRNILVHEYLDLDWDEIYANLQALDDLYVFAKRVRRWMEDYSAGETKL